MTPKWLSDCINEFVEPLGGIDLNLLGHKESLVKTKYSFGDQSDDTFVDPRSFSSWKIPENEAETIRTGSKKPKFVFLHAPPFNKKQTSSNLQPELVLKLMQHIETGEIDHAIVLAPLDSSKYLTNT